MSHRTNDIIARQITAQTESAGKDHGFDETHNPRLPADHWFQDTPEGRCLFLVFYTQACRWSRCVSCNLPSRLSLQQVARADLMKQIDFVFDFLLSTEQKNKLARIIISNNGSILDEVTFSTTALLYFVSRMSVECQEMKVLSIETRCEYVDWHELQVLARALGEAPNPARLELAVGFEAFDDKIRNEIFFKGLSLEVFEKTTRMVARHGFSLKAYFMLKPIPGMSNDEAVEDIHRAIDYLSALSQKFGLPINIHLNPTYVASGTLLEDAFLRGDYSPPSLESVIRAIRHANGTNVSVFVGLNDEGLAVAGGSFLDGADPSQLQMLQKFNRTQEFEALGS